MKSDWFFVLLWLGGYAHACSIAVFELSATSSFCLGFAIGSVLHLLSLRVRICTGGAR